MPLLKVKPLKKSVVIKTLAACFFTLTSMLVGAQSPPDAGQLLQQNRPAPSLPKLDPTLEFRPPATAESLPGGAKVTLKEVQFTANTAFNSQQLSAVLGEVAGRSYDFSGLQALAQKVSDYYRANGYPFARAFIPEQRFVAGVLQLVVVEGRYGEISTTGDARFTPRALKFLAKLSSGDVIEFSRLERTLLVLNDQPGIQTSSVTRPGQAFGTGDLMVDISPTPTFKGELGLDNHNNRYTGEYRARTQLQWDSPFMLGDQIILRANLSDEAQYLGDLSYNLPLGTSGLRGQVGYSSSYYQLAKQFASLDATGKAATASTGFSYPIIRSQQRNFTLLVNYQYKKLDDKQGAAKAKNTKTSQLMPVTLQFNHRDSLGGGGVTYGNLVYTLGKLNLDASLKAADAASAKTQGRFNKLNLDIARVQAVPINNLTLFLRIATQFTANNLDSSEDFGLGGVNGIRAYPSGEGYGDEGWFMQLEARYQLGKVISYTFYDVGEIKVNHTTWVADNNQRALAGYGLGVRYNDQRWSLDASIALRSKGGESQSDIKDRKPRLWATAAWRF